MEHSNLNSLAPELGKILNDIKKLEKIGTISSIEIELTDEYNYYDQLTSLFEGSGGIFISIHTLFVNYPEISFNGLQKILDRIFHLTGESEIIEGMLIHMSLKHQKPKINLSVEIDQDSDIPRIISISDHLKYFEFIQLFQFLWFSS